MMKQGLGQCLTIEVLAFFLFFSVLFFVCDNFLMLHHWLASISRKIQYYMRTETSSTVSKDYICNLLLLLLFDDLQEEHVCLVTCKRSMHDAMHVCLFVCLFGDLQEEQKQHSKFDQPSFVQISFMYDPSLILSCDTE